MLLRGRSDAMTALACVLLAGAMALGVWLRLADPLRTVAIGAEDPYTHIVYTKEALERGWFGKSHYVGSAMYPPGLHVLMGALAPSTVGLYAFTRFAPAAIGALAVVGMYVLASRLASEHVEDEGRKRVVGIAAGATAAFLTAILPEHVFRSDLLFPTALDLALLPAWMLAFHLAMTPDNPHRKAGAILFAVLTPALVFTHPWVVVLFAIPLAAYAALRALRAGLHATSERRKVAARHLAFPVTALVPVTAFAMAFRWDESDTGFADFLANVGPLAPLATLELPGAVLFVVLLVLLALAAAPLAALVVLAADLRIPSAARRIGAAAAAAGLLVPVPVLSYELPIGVDYGRMLGVMPTLLALAGFVVAFVRPSALGDMGIAIAALLFPLTAVNVFDGEHWPVRTVVYFAIGAVLLGAWAAAMLAAGVARIAPVTGRAALPASVLAAALVVSGAVAAVPPEQDDWYRLYDEDDFAAFEETLPLLKAESGTRVFVHSWQSALILKALGDMDDVWYAPDVYEEPDERERKLGLVRGDAYVLVDTYLQRQVDKEAVDLAFLEEEPFELVLKSADGGYRLYKWEGAS